MQKACRLVVLVLCMMPAFEIVGPADRARAAGEDVRYETGRTTKEELGTIKEQHENERTQESGTVGKGTISWKGRWVDGVVWSGDLRLRYEQFWRDGDPAPAGRDRIRFRFRLRFGPTIRIDDFKIGIRLASGSASQTSTNQTLNDAFSTKDIRLDRAFVSWTPSSLKKHLTIHGGKMKNVFYKRVSNNLVWDSDLTPEGLQEQLNYRVGETTLYGDFAQFVLEDTSDNAFPFLLAWEGGVKGTFRRQVRFQFGVSYYDAVNVNKRDIDEPNPQTGNTRQSGAVSSAGGVLVNDYNLLSLGGQLSTQMLGYPAMVEFGWVKNLVSPTSCAPGAANTRGQCAAANAVISGQDTGYQVGGTIGKAEKARTWDVSYWYKWLQADATLSAFSDSDFGDGGNNRFGHIARARYQLTDYLQGSVKFYYTKPLVRSLCAAGEPVCDDIGRLQVNLVWKF